MTVFSIAAISALLAVSYGILSNPIFTNHHMRKEGVDNNFRNKNLLFNPPRCSIKDIEPFIGFKELQEIVERFSERANISPCAVLRKLLERAKNKKDPENEFSNTIDGSDLQELPQPPAFPPKMDFKPKMDPKPPVRLLPKLPTATATPYEVDTRNMDNKNPFLVIPNHTGSESHNDRTTMTQFFPLAAPFNRPFIPPEIATATIHVSSLPDISVTVSPFMTVVEALRQADVEYHSTFGIKVNFSFSRSTVHGIECIVIKNILDVYKAQDSTWKLTIMDKTGLIVYHDVCLPDDDKKVRIRAGTKITVSE